MTEGTQPDGPSVQERFNEAMKTLDQRNAVAETEQRENAYDEERAQRGVVTRDYNRSRRERMRPRR